MLTVQLYKERWQSRLLYALSLYYSDRRAQERAEQRRRQPGLDNKTIYAIVAAEFPEDEVMVVEDSWAGITNDPQSLWFEMGVLRDLPDGETIEAGKSCYYRPDFPEASAVHAECARMRGDLDKQTAALAAHRARKAQEPR